MTEPNPLRSNGFRYVWAGLALALIGSVLGLAVAAAIVVSHLVTITGRAAGGICL
jgi:hypothetical protein